MSDRSRIAVRGRWASPDYSPESWAAVTEKVWSVRVDVEEVGEEHEFSVSAVVPSNAVAAACGIARRMAA